jgi:hypothetical protein
MERELSCIYAQTSVIDEKQNGKQGENKDLGQANQAAMVEAAQAESK